MEQRDCFSLMLDLPCLVAHEQRTKNGHIAVLSMFISQSLEQGAHTETSRFRFGLAGGAADRVIRTGIFTIAQLTTQA